MSEYDQYIHLKTTSILDQEWDFSKCKTLTDKEWAEIYKGIKDEREMLQLSLWGKIKYCLKRKANEY
jgi:hypothetical protein